MGAVDAPGVGGYQASLSQKCAWAAMADPGNRPDGDGYGLHLEHPVGNEYQRVFPLPDGRIYHMAIDHVGGFRRGADL